MAEKGATRITACGGKNIMQAKFTKQEKNLGTLELTFSPEEFKAVLPKAYNRSKNHFRINGFRKGKAPFALALQAYGEQALYEEAIDILVNENLPTAIEENKLELVTRPELDVKAIGSKADTVFELKLTLVPEVKLGKYFGVEAVRPEADVKEEQVEAELKRVQARSARTVPVEGRAIQDGDIVTIDYNGSVDGVEFEGGKAENYDLTIGSKTFIPGFEEQIMGHSVDDSFDVNVTFPAEYHAEHLAGKAAVFKVVIHAIKVKELPVLDDEFAKDVSEFDTLEAYKADLREGIEKSNKERSDREFENNVLKAAVDASEVDIPAIMVENEIDDLIESQSRQFQMQGVSFEQILQYSGQDIQTYRKSLEESAKIHVKTELVLKAIIKAENISLTDEEKDAELEKLAKRYSMTVDMIKKQVGNNLEHLFGGALLRKATDLLCERAISIAPTEEIKL